MSVSRHGGNVYAAARALRKPIAELIDFSASINPLGPSPRAIRTVAQSRRELMHYPDPDCWDLRKLLATRWRCDADRIVIGNGSIELIHLLPAALQLRHLLVIGPTFCEYERAMAKSGGRVSFVLADRANGYRPPLAQVMHLLRAYRPRKKGSMGMDAIVLCNPNSPTGQVCEVTEVRALARVAERHGLRVIIDETFVDYCEEHSILPSLTSTERTIVLRSFTKFYGLPGLRIGYLVSDAETVRSIRLHQPPWSVNALAQSAAIEALGDRRHAKDSRSFIARQRTYLTKQLENLPGCAVFSSCANFVLVELPVGYLAETVVKTLHRQGLLVRDCSNIAGLNERTIRLAIRTRAENTRLVQALARALSRAQQ